MIVLVFFFFLPLYSLCSLSSFSNYLPECSIIVCNNVFISFFLLSSTTLYRFIPCFWLLWERDEVKKKRAKEKVNTVNINTIFGAVHCLFYAHRWCRQIILVLSVQEEFSVLSLKIQKIDCRGSSPRSTLYVLSTPLFFFELFSICCLFLWFLFFFLLLLRIYFGISFFSLNTIFFSCLLLLPTCNSSTHL